MIKAIKNTYSQVKEGELQIIAGSLSFSTLLSLIPFLAVSLLFFQSIGGLEYLYPKVEGILLTYFKESAGAEVSQGIRKLLDRIGQKELSATAIAFLLMTSLSLMHQMQLAFHRVWKIKNKRPFIRQVSVSLIFFILFPMALAAYASFRSMSSLKVVFHSQWQDAIDFGITYFALIILYKFLPATKVKIIPVLLSAFVATIGLGYAEMIFSWLTKSAFNYSKIYGGLAAVPLLCLWILFAWNIVLIGVSLSANLQKGN